MALNNLGLGFMFTAKDAASGVMSRVRQNFVQTEGTTSAAAKRIGNNFETFGTGMAVMSVGLTGLALFAPATQMAMDFGHELGQIRTVIDENALSTQAATDATMGLAAAYGIGPLQQAKGLYETISAGVTDAAKATDLLNVANQFAVGGNTELAGAVDVLTSSVNTYAAQGLTAQEASDSLFLAIAAGKTTAGELSQSLGEVAPTAQALGVGFDELSASIAALTVQGIKTPQAITGMNAMLSNIAKPTSDAEKEAKRLGIQFDATALKTMGLTGVLGQLAGNTKVNDNTFTNLFGSIDGVKSALALTSQGGAKVNEILGQMASKAGATQRAFEIMANTSKFQANRLSALKDNALIVIGQALEPMVVSVMKVVNSVIEGFMKIPAPIRDFMVRAFAAAAAIVAIIGAVIAAKAAMGMLMAGIKAAGLSVAGLAATLGWGILIIGALIAVVAAFKVAIDENLGGIGDAARDMYDVVSLTFQALGQLFSEGEFSGEVLSELEAGNSGIENFVVNIYLFAQKLMGFFESIGSGFSSALEGAGPIFDAFSGSVGRLVDTFEEMFQEIDPANAQASFNGYSAMGGRLGAIFGAVAKAIISILTVAMDIISGFISTLAPVGELISTVFDVVVDVIAEVVSAFGGMDKATDSSSSKWIAFGAAIGNILGVVASLTSALVRTVGGALKSAVNILGGIVDLFTGNVERGITKILFGIISLISGLVLGAIEMVASASDSLLGTSWQKNVAGWRKDMDESLRKYTNMGPRNVGPGGPSTVSDEDKAAAEARSWYAPDTAPPPPPPVAEPWMAYAAEKGSDNGAAEAMTATAEALKAQASQPIIVNSTIMSPDGDVLATTTAKGVRSGAGRSFSPSAR